MTPVTFRKYTESDDKQIILLVEKLWDYVTDLDAENWIHRKPGYGEHTLTTILADVRENDGIIIVALDSDQIVGFIVGTITKFTENERLGIVVESKGNITHLYLEERHRGIGIGRALIAQIEEYLRSKHCAVVSVGVFAPNTKARNFYKKAGFMERNINFMKKLDEKSHEDA